MVKTTLVCIALLCGCGLPRDRHDVLDRVEHKELRAGVTHHPPEIDCRGDKPSGEEMVLLEHIAERLDARLTVSCTSEAALVAALRAGDLEIAAGAFDERSPWLEKAGSTQSYSRHSGRLFLTPPGENRWLMRLDQLIVAGVR